MQVTSRGKTNAAGMLNPQSRQGLALPSDDYKMQENVWQTPRGSLQRSPMFPSWWGGGWLPPRQERHPGSRPFMPRLSPTPNFQTPLS